MQLYRSLDDAAKKSGERAGIGAEKRLDGRPEFGLFHGGLDDGLGHLSAFATLGGNAKFAAYVRIRGADASGDGLLDLAVGNGFAETDVHGNSGSTRVKQQMCEP
jgi:hypothetical protein